MCGIFAILSGREPVQPQDVGRVTATLTHRGPDGSGVHVSPDGRAGLGHTRLAVIDPEGGQQPLANEDGQVVAVVNGEFYDHDRIRAELAQQGHRFRSRSDSEILIHLYEDHGIGCLAHLEGEFAFALWDARQRILFAARDRFGVKPLYTAELNGSRLLASEAKALFAAGVPARWDYRSFLEMCHLYYPHDRSLFAGIGQIPPGHYLIASLDGTSLARYWDLDYPLRDAVLPPREPTEHVRLTRRALEDAVRQRLRADVPVGCYLSGGLDSSLLLALACRMSGHDIDAFTIGFAEGAEDEVEAAAETARLCGARHHVLRYGEAEIADSFAAAVAQSETINPNVNGVTKFLLSRAVRRSGLRVVLTGEGADEIGAGYEFLVRDRLLQGRGLQGRRMRGAAGLAGPGIPQGDESCSTRAVRERLGFVPSWVSWFAEAAMHSRALWSAELCRRADRFDPYESFLSALDLEGQVKGREAINVSLYLWTKSVFANLLLNQLGDRMEMANGVEARLPFLDGPLVTLLRDTPISMKIRGETGKFVFREAARSYLPETIARRRKQAFLAPPPALTRDGPLGRMLQDLLRSEAMARLPFFDRPAVMRFLDAAPRLAARSSRSAQEIGNQLVYMASACVLQQRYDPSG